MAQRGLRSSLSPEERAKEDQCSLLLRDADRFLEQDRLQDAQRLAAEALRLQPLRSHLGYSDSAAMALVQVYNRQDRFPEAAALLDQIYNEHPIGSNLDLDAAISYVQVGRMKEARMLFKTVQLLRDHSEFADYFPPATNTRAIQTIVFLGRGMVDVDQRHYVNARWALAHAVAVAPRNALAQLCLGKALVAMGQVAQARSHFARAIALDARSKNRVVARSAQINLGGSPPK